MTYPNHQEYLYIAQRGLEYEKVNQQMSTNTRKDYRI